jgi:hypothetical protein
VTATVTGRQSAGAAPAGPASPGTTGATGVARAAGRRRAAAAGTTPATLRTLLATLVLLSLAWGAFGGWVASQHSSAASALIGVDEPLSLDARQMYESIADADVTITTAFLGSSQPQLTLLRHYQQDIAKTSADLAELQAGAGAQDPTANAALKALIAGLPVYTGDVADAESEYSLGFPLTGGSFLQVASEEAHLVLLPNAKAVFTQENAAVTSTSSAATGLPTVIAALVLALITAVILFRAQRWLTRRTNRVFSAGLVLASLLLVISVVWVAADFAAARSDLDRGINQGSAPAQELAQASIGVQQIRGDAVLNVISRSGDTSFETDFQAASKQVGPGSGSLLTGAATAQPNGSQAASLLAAAQRQAQSWYTANTAVYNLGHVFDYEGERAAVLGTGPGSSASGYAALEGDIESAIADDQSAFHNAASAGASALNPLEPVVIAASLLMAIGSAWGLSRRLAEYR